MALRQAAVRLVAEHGYDATSTDDIARAANVSPRTFFNYFPTKESAVLLPEGVLNDLVLGSLDRRPLGEDPVTSLAAAAMGMFSHLNLLADSDDTLLFTGIRVMVEEPPLRRILLERRASAELALWEKLQARGVSARDLSVRAAVATVITLAYLALDDWVAGGGTEQLTAVLARCLLVTPDPARFAVGVTAAHVA